MKKGIILSLSITFGLSLGMQILKAQNASIVTVQNEPILSGSNAKIEDIILKSDAIFVGKITQMGWMDDAATGAGAYHGNAVSVMQVLKGEAKANIKVTLYVIATTRFHEDQPKVGTSYIFFIKQKVPNQFDPNIVLKLLPATDANITKVKALIAAAPAHK